MVLEAIVKRGNSENKIVKIYHEIFKNGVVREGRNCS